MIRKNFFISLIVALILLTGIDTWAVPIYTAVSNTRNSGTIVVTYSAVDNGFAATEYGIVLGTSISPTRGVNDQIYTVSSTITDGQEFSATFTGLTGNTSYYIRAYAWDGVVDDYSGNVNYVTVPAATTNAATNLYSTTVTLNGTIATGGGVNSSYNGAGFVWSVTGTNSNPRLSGTGVSSTYTGVTNTFDTPYTHGLTGLTANTNYSYAAVVEDLSGYVDYGATQTFSTTPATTTNAASAITAGNATLNGQVTQGSSIAYTDRGFVYSLTGSNSNPLVGGGSVTSSTVSGTNFSAYSQVITDLTANSNYSFKSWVTNDNGVTYYYGATQTFTTSATAVVPILAATTAASAITGTTASSGYDVTDAGGSAITQSGVVWSTATTPTVALSTKTTQGAVTAAASASVSNLTSLLPGTLYYVRSYATNSVGTGYGSQITFTTTTSAPSTQAKLISWQSLTTTSINVKWVNGNGSKRVVLVKPSTSIATDPTDNNTYTANADFSSGSSSTIGGATVVYNGTGSGVNITNLNPGTTYYIKVYEYNGGAGSELYATGGNTNNPRNFTTVSNAPTQPSGLALTALDATSFDVNWSSNATAMGYYAYLAKDAAFTDYTSPVDWYNATDIGNTTAFVFDGLTTNQHYYWKLAAYNNSGTSTAAKYVDIDNSTDGRVAPLANEPANTSLAITANVVTDNEGSNNTKMALSWSGGALNGTGTLKYLVIAKQAAFIDTDVPTDGYVYTGSTVFAHSSASFINSSYVVYNGTGTSATVTGLTANTQYTFAVYAYQTNGYNNNGNSSDRNYNTAGATATRYTIAGEQATQATAPVYSALATLGTGYNLAWTAATPVNNLHYFVVAKAGSAPTSTPTDGTYPTNLAGDFTAVGDATTNLTDGKVVYSGTGTNVTLTNLTAATNYYFAIYAANVGSNGTTTVNYLMASPLTTNRYTLKAENTTAPTVALTNDPNETGAVDDKIINVAFTKGAVGVDSVIVILRQGGTAPVSPVDGTNYPNPTSGVVLVGNTVTVTTTSGVPTGATTTGAGSYVVYAGNATATNIKIGGLIPNTQYQVLVAQYQRSVNTTENYSNIATTAIYSISTTPTAQVTGLNASAFTTNTITASWTDASAPNDNTLVTIRAGAGITNHPVDGNTYASSSNLIAPGADLGNSTYVLYTGGSGASPYLIAGLSPSTLYTFNAYSYKNDAQQANVQINYKITSPQSIQRVTLAAAQTDGAAALTFSNVTSSGMSVVVGGASAITNTKYLVVVTTGGTPNAVDPTSGIGNYAGTANSTTPVNYSTLTQLYSPAGSDQAGTYVLYDGPAATIAITNMSAKTQYSFSVWAYNTALTAVTGATESNNDKAFFATETVASRFTTATEATAQAGATTITSPTLTGMTYSVAAGASATGNTLGYLSVIDVAGTEEVPADGTGYTAATNFTGTVLTTDARVVYDGASLPTTVALTGLASNTNYTIRTYAYAWDGANAQTKNYLTSTAPSSASKYTLATQPNDMTAVATTTNRTTTTATLNWTDNVAPGTGSLITMAQSTDANAVAVADAVDGTSYTAVSATHAWNSALLSGSTYVGYNGAAGTQTINITGLTANKRYDIEGVHYNGTAGTGAENYSNATVTNNFFTLSTEPTAQVTAFAAGVTADATTSLNLSWTAAAYTPTDGSTLKYFVIAKAGGTAPADLPVDGTNYTVADNDFSTNQIITTAGEQLVYQGTGTSITVTGLTAATQYSFAIYAYAEGLHTSTVNYNTTSAPTVTRYTLKAAPTVNATTGVFSSATNSGATSGVTFSWTAGTGTDNYLVVVSPAAHTVDAVDGTSYTADADYAGTGSTLGNGKVVYNGTGTSVAITGLTAATTYEFTVYGFAQTTSGETNNYKIDDEVSASTTTLAQPITAEATALNVDNLAVGTYRLNWTAGTGPNTIGYVVVARSGTVAGTTDPSDGTGYTAADTDPDNTTSALGNGEVVYNGANTTVTLTGLSDATAYTFKVYAYNWNGSNISSRNYGSGNASVYIPGGTSPFSRISLNTVPAVQATASVGTRTTTSLVANYDYPNGTGTPNNTLLTIRPTSVVTVTDPSTGVYYNGLTSGSVNATSGATQLSTSSSTVVASTGFMNGAYPTSVTISGLTANTQYTISPYAANITDNALGNSNSDANYKTTVNAVTAYTLVTAPNAPTAAVFTSFGTTSYNLAWSAPSGGADGYVVLAKQGSAITTTAGNEPAGGTQYTDPGNLAFGGDAFNGGANELMYVGTGTSIAITGLTANTQYAFAVYAYSNGASAAQTINYSTALSATRYTLKAAPTAAPSLTTVTKGTSTLILTATAGAGGADKVVVYALKGSSSPATTPTTSAPANGTAGTVVAGSSVLTTGTGVLVYDGNYGASAVSLSALDNATYYSFIAYAYNTGASTETNNYFGTASAVESTNSLATEPTTQAAAPTITGRTATTLNYSTSTGNGSAVLVSNQLQTNAFTDAPVDGTDYTPNTAFGSGTDLGNSIRVKKDGVLTTGSVTGLTASTQYTLKTYAYNGTATGLANFLTTSPGTTTIRTLATAPTAQPGAISFTNATYDVVLNKSGYTVNWSAPAGGAQKYLLFGKSGSVSSFTPTNGTQYTLSQTVGDATVYYVGAATNAVITGLDPNTQYSWSVVAYNDDTFVGESENYFGTVTNASRITVPSNPLIFSSGSSLSKTAVTDQTITISWPAASQSNSDANATAVTGYLVVARQGSAVDVTPSDGVNHPSAANFGDQELSAGRSVVYKSTGTSVQVTGLSSGTTYYFEVFSYREGGSAISVNYSHDITATGGNLKSVVGNFSTLAAAPGSSPSGMAVSARTNTSINTTWTSGVGAASTLISQNSIAFVNGTDDPVNGTGYTAPTTIGGASVKAAAAQVNNYSFTSLTADTKYFFRAYDYNGSGATSNYGTGTNYTGVFGYTLANQPSAQVVLTTTGAVQDGNTLTIPFTYGGSVGDSIIVLAKTSDITLDPTDGTPYNTGATIGGATVNSKFRYTADGNVSVTGLSAGTSYYVAAFAYKGSYNQTDGVSTANYEPTIGTTNGVGSNKVQLSTIAVEPSPAPSGVSVSARITTGQTISWTQPSGAKTLVLAREANATAPTVLDGADYSAGASLTYATATTVLSNYKVLYDGAATTSITAVLPNTGTQYYYYVYAYNGTAGSQNYTAAATGNHYTLATAPTGASTSLAAGATNAGGSIGLTWNTADDLAKTLLVARNGGVPTAPTNGQDYPTTVDGTTSVTWTEPAGATDAKTRTVTGLIAGQTYQFSAYAFTGAAVTGTTPSGASEGTNNYAAVAGPLTVIARSAEPTAQATSLVASSVLDNTATLSWTAASGGATRYIVIATLNANTIANAPVDGTKYANGANYSGPLNETNAYGNLVNTSFTSVVSNSSIVYNGTGTSVNLTNLSSNTTYKAVVFAFNEAATVGSENYNPTINTLDAVSSNYISFATLNTEPASQVTIGTVTPSGTALSVAYSAAVGSGRLVVYKSGASTPTFVPVDGTVYTDGTTQGDGTVLNTTATPFVITGLNSSTQYSFAVYEYNGTGSARNYRQTSPATGNGTTTSAPVLTSLAFTSGTATSYTTANSTIVVELRDAGNAVYTETTSRPITLTFYTSSATFNMGTVNTTVGQTNVTFNNINFSNTVTNKNGTLVGNLSATTTGVTSAAYGSNNIVVIAAEPTTQISPSVTRPSASQIDFDGNLTGGSGNSGFLVYQRKGSTFPTTGSEVDGAVLSTSAVNNDGTTSTPILLTTTTGINSVTGFVSGTQRFVLIPFKGALNATINYGQSLGKNNTQFKEPNFQDDFDNNVANESGFDVSKMQQNPVTDKVVFNLHSYSNQMFSIDIVSTTGEKIATGLSNTGFGRGKHLIQIPLSENIASGTYHILIISGGEILTMPFVVIK